MDVLPKPDDELIKSPGFVNEVGSPKINLYLFTIVLSVKIWKAFKMWKLKKMLFAEIGKRAGYGDETSYEGGIRWTTRQTVQMNTLSVYRIKYLSV